MHASLTGILDKMISAFSWMLIHSLWQGLFLAIIAGAVLMLNKRSSAARRYNLALGLFFAFTSMCIFTFIWEWKHISSQTIVPPFAGTIGANVSALLSGNVHSLKQLVKTFTNYFSVNAPMIVMVWLVFFLFKSVKMIASLVYNQRIRTQQIYEPSDFWADTVKKFSEKLQISKPVRLLQSGYIKMPVVIGHLKPIILIPVGLMAGLPTEQIEAILLHELAHIRRNDYFINFLQNIAEAVFFFNPGLLWISSLLREERENCCDDMALAQTQDKRGFVQALISFKELELYSTNYSTAFPGKKNYLLRRVTRIMDSKYESLGFGEKMFFMAGILALCVVMTTATVAQIKDRAIAKVLRASHIIAYAVPPRELVVAQPPAKNAMGWAEHTRASIRRKKMTMSIVGIRHEPVQSRAVAPSSPSIPAPPATAAVKQTLSEKEQAAADKLQGLRDQLEAKKQQEDALRDQEQARKDQEQALRDQQQARLDQIQAKKDQEQARLDQIQAKKDQEQAKNEARAISEKQKADKALQVRVQAKVAKEETMAKSSSVSVQE